MYDLLYLGRKITENFANTQIFCNFSIFSFPFSPFSFHLSPINHALFTHNTRTIDAQYTHYSYNFLIG